MGAPRRQARPLRQDVVNAIRRRIYLMQAACQWEDRHACPDDVFEALYELTREVEELLPRLTDPKLAALLDETA